MTIAIGRWCTDGIIIATDTRITWEDGRTSDVAKIRCTEGYSGNYVIAHSCADANAAESLVGRIDRDLKDNDPKFLAEFENIVKAAMTAWHSDFSGGNIPDLGLLIGAFVNPLKGFDATSLPCSPAPPSGPPGQMIGPAMGLYLCQPPNTVASQNGYVAIGAGAKITDPLFNSLFDDPVSPRVCLGQISYLMHRAKKDYGAYCGGQTDAAFLKSEHTKPIEVQRGDMAMAESFGYRFDKMLSRAASVIIPEEYATDREVLDMTGAIHALSVAYRRLEFRSRAGVEIS